MIETAFRILLFWTFAVSTECLVCYDCKNITDYSICNKFTTCGPDESCFMDRTGANFTLGCVSNTQCSVHTSGGTSIIGRSLTIRQDHRCHECCSTNNCAVHLCSHHELARSCMDDETVDCARMNTLFDICSDVRRAKSVCPRFCGLCVVDGQWSAWTIWTNCSVTCGNGTQARTRICNNPPPLNGGKDCHGNVTELKQCVRELCPVHGGWTDWMPWGTCSATCNVGLQRRHRSCTNPVPSRVVDYCFGDKIDVKLCFPGACTDGTWSTWNDWSNCITASGADGGFKTRNRSCSNPSPSPYGKNCDGYRDCLDIKEASHTANSGVYSICLWKTKTEVNVYCDMTTNGGGWTVFQRRINGSIDFYRTFYEYEHGFGNVGEFWLGLHIIQEMAAIGKTDLRIDLTAADGRQVYELFNNFSLSPGPAYTLHIDPGTGTAGDSGWGLSNNTGQNFFTKDSDNSHGCAVYSHGGWWYSNCAYANLNGGYDVPGTRSDLGSGFGGVIYYDFEGFLSLKTVSMMLRRNK